MIGSDFYNVDIYQSTTNSQKYVFLLHGKRINFNEFSDSDFHHIQLIEENYVINSDNFQDIPRETIVRAISLNGMFIKS